MAHIITMGGGGFSIELKSTILDRYVVDLAGKSNPKACFLSQASGEAREYIINFYWAYNQLGCQASHLSLFQPHTADLESFLLAQDIIYVGGGNTKSMLALWREWNIPAILRRANEQGTILAGLSAGCICWYEQGLTDSIPGDLTALPCLGVLAGSCSPHYDSEAQRRPSFHRLIASGEMIAGHAFDDNAAGHFVDGKLVEVISERPNAKGYYVEAQNGQAVETVLDTRYIG